MNALYSLILDGGYISGYLNGKLFIHDCDYFNIAEAVLFSATGEPSCSARAVPDLISYCIETFPDATSIEFTSHDIWEWHQAWEEINNCEDGD